ncbi:hypothetical protein RJT34_21507 [Clitoria ternatea]|uniref:Uncharacterized protein n=1 Tax=Clitoria ternatea TaxID=43366 RepID=A0AAN9IUN3_CLITE
MMDSPTNTDLIPSPKPPDNGVPGGQFYDEYNAKRPLISVWNIREAMSKDGQCAVKKIIDQNCPHVLVLLEAHIRRLWRRWVYEEMSILEVAGFAGGLWVLKNMKCTLSMQVLDHSNQVITMSIGNGSLAWTVSWVYASPRPIEWERL